MAQNDVEAANAHLSPLDLKEAVKLEGDKFQEYYLWLEKAMPRVFFEEVSRENLMLITHSLMGFSLQGYFSTINRKSSAIGLCLDTPDADLRILSPFTSFGIKNYQAYVSKVPAPFQGVSERLRIATIGFTEAIDASEKNLPEEAKADIRQHVKTDNPEMTDQEFEECITRMSARFLLALPPERRALAINLYRRAQTRDNCQFEVRYEEQWQEKGSSSMYIILAWRNTPKHNFLYRLARVVYRHGLSVKRANAAYTDPSNRESVLVMALSLHGSNGQAVWDVADIPDLLREISTVKYFEAFDPIDQYLVDPGIISGNMGNFLRTATTFIHQTLLPIDPNIYTLANIEEALCRHPELTLQLCETFKLRFDPGHCNLEEFGKARAAYLSDVAQLDTGHEHNDTRRKNVLLQGMNFVTHTLKTNFFRLNYTALSFRLDPAYLDQIPFDRSKKFPELPYAIFFIQGMYFFGFHIRFKDLARGGLRTIYPTHVEQMVAERNHVFAECYNLAWTQHKKNKDIPEGGAKGVIFLHPLAQIDVESPILKKELEWLKMDQEKIEKRIRDYRQELRVEYLYQAQRSFIDSLVTIVNCHPDGTLRARFIVDYWKRPEYIYLGPDENLHDSMIEWIADYSRKYRYKPGRSFISSKPIEGINHKEYGVTSLGVNVYMHKVLEYLGIRPESDVFTLKMTGGPDGDVAGNQLLNLYHLYPNTAKLLALTDGTGTIHDDKGLDLALLKDLFHQGKGISHYPPEKLSSGGFLVIKENRRYPSAYIQETLCWRKVGNRLVEEWLPGSETNHLLRTNVHQTKTDVFIPAGGRPRTLNETNIEEFFDTSGQPTARAIIEGANLYLNGKARRILEDKGVLIIKDSSANKGGVICSSFEVLCGLALDEQSFLTHKKALVGEILERLRLYASYEADILLKTHQQTGEALTLLSDRLSEHINRYTYELLDYLDLLPLPTNREDPMIRCFLNYCLPTLRENFTDALLKEIPDHHKKAIIACHLSSYMVYKKGLEWSPSIVDILPLILSGADLTE